MIQMKIHMHSARRWMSARRARRRVGVVVTMLVIAVGTAACGGGDVQGRKEPTPAEVAAQVAQLRLEVQALREELAALAETAVTTTAPETITPETMPPGTATPETAGTTITE